MKAKIFCAVLMLFFLALSVCSTTPENDVVGVTEEGNYIRSGSQIFFAKKWMKHFRHRYRKAPSLLGRRFFL